MKKNWMNGLCTLALCSMMAAVGSLGAVPATTVQAAEIQTAAIEAFAETESSATEETTAPEETTESEETAASEETTAPEETVAPAKATEPESSVAEKTTTAVEAEKIDLTAVPANYKVKADNGKNILTWDPVPGATHYLVYRQDPDSAMAEIVEEPGITETTYEDIDILPGISYIYMVRAAYAGENGSLKRGAKSQEISVVSIIPSIVLKSATVVTGGVQIKWTAMRNVDGYYVVRKTSSTGYKTVGKIASQSTTTWTDKNVTMGETYTYSVRGYANDSGVIRNGRYNTTGLTVTVQIPGPVIKSVVAAEGKVTVSWNAVPNAVRYYIYRKGNGTTSYQNIGNTTSLTYEDKTIQAGREYTYTVKAQVLDNGVKKYTAYDKAGLSVVSVVPAPKLTSTAVVGTAITLKWEAVAGAEGYRVYRKTGTGSWVKVKDLKTLTYTDTDTEIGGSYTYTVRAYMKDGTVYRWSGYDKTGLTAKIPLPKPEIKSSQTYSGGVVVNWTPVAEADGYQIYRKAGSGKYTRIASIASGSQSFYWNYNGSYAPVAGTTYTYAVRAYKIVNGTASYSAASYMSSSVVCRPAQPIIASISTASGKDTIVWSTVSGASLYRIQYLLPGSAKWQDEKTADGKNVNITASSSATKQQRSVTANVEGTVYRVRAYANGVWNSDVSDKVSNSKGRYTKSKVLFVGDSITFGQSWYGSQKAAAVTFADRIAQITGCEIVNKGKPSLRALDVEGSAASYGLTDSGYDVIVIALGTNDYNRSVSMSSFNRAMNSIFSSINSNNPSAKVVVITPNYRMHQYYTTELDYTGAEVVNVPDYSKPGMNVANKKGYTLQDYVNSVTKIAKNNGAYVYNSVNQGVLNSGNCFYRTVDGLHPTPEMYAMMGTSIAKFMENAGIFKR